MSDREHYLTFICSHWTVTTFEIQTDKRLFQNMYDN